MMKVRRSESRGQGDHGWLKSQHSFSFAGYYDPEFMGHRALRVINEDRVAPGAGFGQHGHRDMEIVSYVVSGALEHKDSMGTSSIIRPGELQRMSAGRGVRHSEYNQSSEEPVHFLQIWIEPAEQGIEPSYAQKDFSAERKGALRLVASRDGRDGSLTLYRDTDILAAELAAGERTEYAFRHGGHGYLQLVRGGLSVSSDGDDVTLQAGDGLALSDCERLELNVTQDSEFLLFDLD